MKLLTEGGFIKINNFVDHLIENYFEKGKTYDFEMKIDDKYDKKMMESREKSLKNNLLVKHNDGFDILNLELVKKIDKFKEAIGRFTDNDLILNNLNDKELQNQFVNYKISFLDQGQKHNFEFSFYNLID
jgi:hypothetical protein